MGLYLRHQQRYGVKTMFHLYIKDQFIKAYTSHKAAQNAVAKMRHKVNIDGWRIVEAS
jgi:hypothetical protein